MKHYYHKFVIFFLEGINLKIDNTIPIGNLIIINFNNFKRSLRIYFELISICYNFWVLIKI